MDQDLQLFNELIRQSIPDVEVDETLFAYYCPQFQVIITKAAEVNTGLKIKSMYKVSISGALNMTRFVNDKENALIKANLVINDNFTHNKLKEEDDYITEDYGAAELKYIARTIAHSTEYED